MPILWKISIGWLGNPLPEPVEVERYNHKSYWTKVPTSRRCARFTTYEEFYTNKSEAQERLRAVMTRRLHSHEAEVERYRKFIALMP